MTYPATNPRDTYESLFVVNVMLMRVKPVHERMNGLRTPHRRWTVTSLLNFNTVKKVKGKKSEKQLDEFMWEMKVAGKGGGGGGWEGIKSQCRLISRPQTKID